MRRLGGALAGLMMLAACVERAAPTADASPRASAGRDAGLTAPSIPAPPPAPAAKPPPAQVAVKEARGAGDAVRAGARLALPAAFVLPDQAGRLTLDFEHGARVAVAGPARVLADVSDQDVLACGGGEVSVDLAPSAPTPRSGFALLTPSGMLTLIRGGRYALRVEADGSTRGFVVWGSVTLRAAAAPRGADEWLLGAGESFVLGPSGELKRAKHTLRTLAEAEAAVRAARAPRKAQRASDDAQLDTLLQGALHEVKDLQERQDVMLTEHRALARARDAGAERLAALQRDLAEQAEQLSRARARLRLSLGQRAAAAQTSVVGGDDPPSVSARELLFR